MKDDNDIVKPLADLHAKLEEIPATDRGIHWESKSSFTGSERLEVHGLTARALKFLLDNTETITAAIRQVKQIRESNERLKQEQGRRIGLTLDRASLIAQHDARVTELLEANNRYQQEARDARADLKRISSVNEITVKYDEAMPGFAARIREKSCLPYGNIEVEKATSLSPISAGELRDVFATLRSIDRHEILEAGYDMPDGSWDHFRENPMARFLECNDECRDAIVKVINKRRGAN